MQYISTLGCQFYPWPKSWLRIPVGECVGNVRRKGCIPFVSSNEKGRESDERNNSKHGTRPPTFPIYVSHSSPSLKRTLLWSRK